jgi:hypothetical protein
MDLQRVREHPAGTCGWLLCGCILRKHANVVRFVEYCDRHRTGPGARFDMESWVRPCEDPFLVAVTIRIEAIG